MHDNAGEDNSLPVPTTAPLSVADARRLRLALRLLFAPQRADRIAAMAAPGMERDHALASAAQAAERWYIALRVLRVPWAPHWSPGRGDRPAAPPPLGPLTGAPPRGAVDLALHLGLNLDAEALADLTDDTPEQAGTQMLQARRTVARRELSPCPEFGSAIGRHRDRALDPAERAALFHHARECPACNAMLAASEDVDAALLQELQAVAHDLPSLPPRRSHLPRLASLGAAALVVVLLGVSLAALAEGMCGPTASLPSPSVRPAGPSPSGWLLTGADDGAVSALDLQTGTIRPVAPAVPPGRFVRRLLSPDGQLIATWTPPFGPNGPEPTGTIAVSHLDGTPLRSWGLGGGPGPDAGTLLGWLGNSSVLVREALPWQGDATPAPGPTNAQSSQLVALDVATGVAHVLLRGQIASASPSPDGTRVLVTETYDPRWRGITAELRAVGTDGLSPPLVTLDHRLAPAGQIVWAPDGSRVFLARVADANPSVPATAIGSTTPPGDPTGTEIVALDRAGTETPIVAAGPGRLAYPVSAAPDDSRLVYVEESAAPAASGGEVWLTTVSASPPVALVATSVPEAVTAAWLPDGGALLRVDLPFYLPADPGELALGTVAWPVLLHLNPDGVAQPIPSAPTATDGPIWLGWEPADAPLPAPTSSVATARLPVPGAPRPASQLGATLDASSAVSPDGGLVDLADASGAGAVIWDKGTDSESRVLHGAHDLSWIPGTQTLIGVSHVGVDPAAGSRITLYASRLAAAPSLDFRHFDPAGIGNATKLRYARPLVAPDGLAISYFVVDDARRTTVLWLSSWTGGAHPIARWTDVSAAAGGALAPVAVWTVDDTLLFAEPAPSPNGLPQQVDIRRVAVGPDGPGTPVTIAVARAHGSDRSVEVTDLTVSPNHSRLAWRVRHLTGASAASGSYDTLVVAPLASPAEQVEIARTSPGGGLAWSPDGRWIAAGIGGQVSLLAPDGTARVPLSPVGVAGAFPVWVSADDVWYTTGNGVVQVSLRGP